MENMGAELWAGSDYYGKTFARAQVNENNDRKDGHKKFAARLWRRRRQMAKINKGKCNVANVSLSMYNATHFVDGHKLQS